MVYHVVYEVDAIKKQ